MHKKVHSPTLALVKHDHDESDSDKSVSDWLDNKPISLRKPKKVKKEPKLLDESDNDSLDDVPLSLRKRKQKVDDPIIKHPTIKEPKLEVIYPKPDNDYDMHDDFKDDQYTNDKLNYKALYKQCLREKNKIKNECDLRLKKLKIEYEDEINNGFQNYKDHQEYLTRTYEDKILEIKDDNRKKMEDLESLKEGQCAEKLKDFEKKCRDAITSIKEAHQKEVLELEDGCKERLNMLKDQIKVMEENDNDLSSLNKAIYNCVTMEELFKIQSLVQNHQLDVVVEQHLKTLQNLFVSLSHGVLPICQPQRERVTDKQRRVVDQIQTSTKSTAKRIMKENRSEIVNLFMIIKDSLKLARNTFNRYGSRIDL